MSGCEYKIWMMLCWRSRTTGTIHASPIHLYRKLHKCSVMCQITSFQWLYWLEPTLHSKAHFQADSARCIGSSASVSPGIARLNEGDLQRSWTEDPQAYGFTQHAPVFVPRDRGGRGAVSLAPQRHGGVHRCQIFPSVWADHWRDFRCKEKCVGLVHQYISIFVDIVGNLNFSDFGCILYTTGIMIVRLKFQHKSTYLALWVWSCRALCQQGFEPHICTFQSLIVMPWRSADFH